MILIIVIVVNIKIKKLWAINQKSQKQNNLEHQQ